MDSFKCFWTLIALLVVPTGNTYAECEGFNELLKSMTQKAEPEAAPKLGNLNAALSAADYQNTHERGANEYIRRFGQSYLNKLQSLKPGNHYIDSGTGLGLAGISAAKNQNIRFTGIGTQDFWELYLNRLEKLTAKDIHASLKSQNTVSFNDAVELAGVPINTLTELNYATSYRFNFKSDNAFRTADENTIIIHSKIDDIKLEPEKAISSVQNFSRYLRSSRDKILQNTGSELKIGYTEEVLPTIAKAELITDFYGAYFYSADKAKLVEQFYNKLNHGGMAFIAISGKTKIPLSSIENYGGIAMVKLHHESLPFEGYLMKKYPKIFKYNSTTQSLIINTDPKIPILKLNLEMDPKFDFKKLDQSTIVPDNIVFREK